MRLPRTESSHLIHDSILKMPLTWRFLKLFGIGLHHQRGRCSSTSTPARPILSHDLSRCQKSTSTRGEKSPAAGAEAAPLSESQAVDFVSLYVVRLKERNRD